MNRNTFLKITLITAIAFCNFYSFSQNHSFFPNQHNQISSPVDSFLKISRERAEKRTLFSREFVSATGTLLMQVSSQPVNFKNQRGVLEPINIYLEPHENTWIVKEQAYPCFLNADKSTSITLDNGYKLSFNENNLINGIAYPQSKILVEKSIATITLSNTIKKKIIFRNGAIETDFILSQPTETKTFTASENIEYPANYRLIPDTKRGKLINGKWFGDYVLLSDNGIEEARFHAPVCRDANGKSCNGYYELLSVNKKHILNTVVPQHLLETAKYPLTIDPLVTGPISIFLGKKSPSCLLQNYASGDSLLITVPGGITISNLFITDNYTTADTIPMKDGRIYYTTKCDKSAIFVSDTSANGIAWVYQSDLPMLTCCFLSSCSPTTFYLKHHIARTVGGATCDTNLIWYDPNSVLIPFNYPLTFSAYVMGKTTEVIWSVSPPIICSNRCNLTLNVSGFFGVPPYTFSHPWTKQTASNGYHGACDNTGTTTFTLQVPNCPTYCGSSAQTLVVPPPVVVDACGDTVYGLTPRNIVVNPSPKITSAPDSLSICTGSPVNFVLSSCFAGTTINWKGSNNTSGTGNISDTPIDTLPAASHITYKILSSIGGCKGDTAIVSATVNSFPKIIITKNDTIELGDGKSISASGGSTYSWKPSTGLSCNKCPNPIATPKLTTTYYVTASNAKCSTSGSVTIYVIDITIIIPNVFTPNGDGKNDFFVIKNLEYHKGSHLEIYNRWGNKLYESANYENNWDGGKATEGVYYYILTLADGKQYHGYFELLK